MSNQTPTGDGPLPPTAPPPGAPGTAGGPPVNGFFAKIRSIGLYRSEDRWIGGVAGGVAARFGLDPLLVRGLFAVSVLLGGFGLALYAIGWALLPEQRDGRIHIEGLTLGHPDIALLGSLGMLVAGLSFGSVRLWPVQVPGVIQAMFWLGAMALAIVLVATLISRRSGQPRPYAAPPSTPPRAPFQPPAPGSPAPAPAPYRAPAAPYGGPAARVPGPTSAAAYPPPGAPITMSVPPTAPPPRPPVPPYQAPPAQPYRYVAAPPQPPLPVVPKPRRRGPGSAIVGITVALSLFVIAGVLIAQRAGWLDRPTLATAAALIVVIFGVAIIVAGLLGRSSGVLSFLAVVAVLFAIPTAFAARADWTPWNHNPNAIHVGAGTTAITDPAQAANGVQVGWGDATVDLTGVPLEENQRLTVPIRMNGGDLTILVPEGVRASATVDLLAGQATWRVGSDNTSVSGFAVSDQAFGDATGDELRLDVSMGFGNVTIEEER